jgi:hypothetical protein
MSDKNALEIIKNPYNNVYWFARMLINNDKYGGIGGNDTLLSEIAVSLRRVLDDKMTAGDKVSLAVEIIKNLTLAKFKKASTKIDRINLFCCDLADMVKTPEDIAVFILTLEKVMLPINKAMEKIPNNDREFTIEVAKSYLDKLGYEALATVVNFWDDLGTKGCLNAERAAVIQEFGYLRDFIAKHNAKDADIILTAFVQEFERRLGQKRKGRAGGSLEDVASFLFGYFDITAENRPEHFQADIEVDKWIRCADKWLIGISCKRTLRERWKQVSSADASILSKFKIKELWHLVVFDEDLSDDKLTSLGSQRHIFYLRDDSRRLLSAQNHIGMRDYVRPISRFISDIKREQSDK